MSDWDRGIKILHSMAKGGGNEDWTLVGRCRNEVQVSNTLVHKFLTLTKEYFKTKVGVTVSGLDYRLLDNSSRREMWKFISFLEETLECPPYSVGKSAVGLCERGLSDAYVVYNLMRFTLTAKEEYEYDLGRIDAVIEGLRSSVKEREDNCAERAYIDRITVKFDKAIGLILKELPDGCGFNYLDDGGPVYRPWRTSDGFTQILSIASPNKSGGIPNRSIVIISSDHEGENMRFAWAEDDEGRLIRETFEQYIEKLVPLVEEVMGVYV